MIINSLSLFITFISCIFLPNSCYNTKFLILPIDCDQFTSPFVKNYSSINSYQSYLDLLCLQYFLIIRYQQMAKGQVKLLRNLAANENKKRIVKSEKNLQKNNLFSLKNLETSEEILVEFPEIKVGKAKTILGIPKYRNDGLYYTPSFWAPNQLEKLLSKEFETLHEERMRSQIQEAMQNQMQEIPPLEPEKTMSKCMVCGVDYESYQEHIKLETHKKKVKSSYYNTKIWELCLKYDIERFFKGFQQKDVGRNEQQEQKYMANIFNQQDQMVQFQSKASKEALYQQLKQQLKHNKENVIKTSNYAQSNDSIFDVIEF